MSLRSQGTPLQTHPNPGRDPQDSLSLDPWELGGGASLLHMGVLGKQDVTLFLLVLRVSVCPKDASAHRFLARRPLSQSGRATPLLPSLACLAGAPSDTPGSIPHVEGELLPLRSWKVPPELAFPEPSRPRTFPYDSKKPQQ